MAGLLDIAPSTETVTVRGTAVEVTGISAKGIASLLARFPEIQTLIQGGEVDVASLLEMGGDLVSAIIAAGCGLPGNLEAEKVASTLGLESQAEILSVIIKQTMPGGIGPFVAKIEGLGDVLNLKTLPQPENASLPSTTPNVNGSGYPGSSAI